MMLWTAPPDMTTWFPPTREELQRPREALALWMHNDDWYERNIIWEKVWAEAKAEYLNKNPWARQYLDTIS